MKKRITVILLMAFFLVMVATGCAASKNDSQSADYYSEAEVAEQPAGAPEATEQAAAEDSGSVLGYEGSILEPGVERKIVYNGYFEIRSKEFDTDYDRLMNALKEMGGYIEESTIAGTKPEDWQDRGRHATLKLRVPSKNFDNFVGRLGEFGETVTSSVNGTDISLEYYDTETRLKTLRTREERLLELLKQAAGLEDIIELEKELADVSYEIQMHQTNLRNYDSLIGYSTITIELEEVNKVQAVKPSDEDLGTRISDAFYSVLNVLADFGEGMLIFLIGGAPILVPLAVIAVVIILLVKRRMKRRKNNVPQP